MSYNKWDKNIYFFLFLSNFLSQFLATDILAPSWSTLEGRLSVVNGKELMSLVNSWLRNQHKVKSSRDKLIMALTPDDISQEIKDVINLLTK